MLGRGGPNMTCAHATFADEGYEAAFTGYERGQGMVGVYEHYLGGNKNWLDHAGNGRANRASRWHGH